MMQPRGNLKKNTAAALKYEIRRLKEELKTVTSDRDKLKQLLNDQKRRRKDVKRMNLLKKNNQLEATLKDFEGKHGNEVAAFQDEIKRSKALDQPKKAEKVCYMYIAVQQYYYSSGIIIIILYWCNTQLDIQLSPLLVSEVDEVDVRFEYHPVCKHHLVLVVHVQHGYGVESGGYTTGLGHLGGIHGVHQRLDYRMIGGVQVSCQWKAAFSATMVRVVPEIKKTIVVE
nr:unnamed protein product [Callosobruchus chinensis]